MYLIPIWKNEIIMCYPRYIMMISCASRHLYVVGLYTTLFVISPDPPNLISWVNFGLFAAWISGYRPTLYFTLYCIKYRLSLQVLLNSQM